MIGINNVGDGAPVDKKRDTCRHNMFCSISYSGNIPYNTELYAGIIYVMHFIFSCDSMFNVFIRCDEYMRQLTGSSLVKALTDHLSRTQEFRKTVVHLQLNKIKSSSYHAKLHDEFHQLNVLKH